MKQILFVLEDINNTGSPLTSLHVIKALPKEYNVIVLILCSNTKNDLYRKNEYEKENVTFIILKMPHLSTKKFKLFFCHYIRVIKNQIKKIFNEYHFDYAYLNRIMISGDLCRFIKKNLNARIVFNSLGQISTDNSQSLLGKVYDRNIKLTCELADYFVALSSQCFPTKYNIQGKKLILEDYVDMEIKNGTKEFSKKETISIGQIGYFNKNKNQLFTLYILNKLLAQNKNASVKFIGFPIDGNYLLKMKEFIINNNLQNNVTFYDKDYDKNLFFDSIDILMMPSHKEGYGLVIKESLCRKTPVICSLAIPPEASCGSVLRTSLEDEKSWIKYIISEEYKKDFNDSKNNEDFISFNKNVKDIFTD